MQNWPCRSIRSMSDRKTRLADGLKRLAQAARNGTIPHGSIEDGTLRIDRLTANVPDDSAEELILRDGQHYRIAGEGGR
jgi:hypothetical protein